MTALRETGYAKINLALHVRRKREDGYHELETVFAFAEDGDLLEASAATDLTLQIHGPHASALESDPSADNLVLRAARALQDATGVKAGALLRLDKRLPVASGIGGGSADAAAALRLLTRLWGLDAAVEHLQAIAAGLGADVPACVASRSVRGDGRGDALDVIDGASWRGIPLLLVNPGVPLSTASVFATWDGCDRGPLAARDLRTLTTEGRNDLERPAMVLRPEISEVLALLRLQPGVVLARMSGSGATCFALFESVAARVAATHALRGERPGWWCLETRLR